MAKIIDIHPIKGYFIAMGKARDITNQRFGKLIALYKVKARDKSGSFWQCKCDCGIEKSISSNKLLTGRQISCGCEIKLRLKNGMNLTHGMANKTRTYRTWKEMRQRCLNPKSDKWKWYGAKGVKICQRWLDSFEAFLEDMGERPLKMTLDRKNPFGNYEPSNCKWSTQKEQMNNTRNHYSKKMVSA